MKKVIFMCLLLLSVTAHYSGSALAQAQAPAQAPAGPEGEQNVEVLLNTMNEVLEENRKIRDQLANNEDALQKMARENNALRGQVRQLKAAHEEAGQQDLEKMKRMEGSIADLKQTITVMSKENDQLTEIKNYHEQRMPELERESRELKALLDSAILEGERGEYLALIQNAQNMTLKSLEELKADKAQSLTLQEEMSAAHYKLGNMLYDMKDFKNALISYEKALESNPNDPWVHHNMGVIYDYYIHDLKKALFHYKQYLQYKPYDEQANEIRERILEMELKKNMIPEEPLSQEFYKTEVKVPR